MRGSIGSCSGGKEAAALRLASAALPLCMQMADLEKAKGKCPCGEASPEHFYKGKMVTPSTCFSGDRKRISQARLVL